jgi:predicted alpha/beta hydrolase family esterase
VVLSFKTKENRTGIIPDMKKAILIHGYNDESEYRDVSQPSPSNNHWFPWLQRQLLLHGIETQTPEMPGFFKPNYEAWKSMLENFKPDEYTTLVGHSCGGGFLVRWLSETNTRVGNVVLVAPWLDPEKNIDPEFFNFVIDRQIVAKTAGITVLYSTDDSSDILQTVETLKDSLSGVNFVEFQNKGHFVSSSLGSEQFPELLNVILKDDLQ